MSRMSPLTIETSDGKAKELLGAVKKKLGRVPNMMATLAHSPAALEGYLTFSGILGHGVLTAKEREAVAIYVGALNDCAYCVSAHSQFAKMAGFSEQEIDAIKAGKSSSARLQALLTFSKDVVEKRGFVSEAELSTAEAAGVTRAELLETIAVVALNIFTNYANHFMDPVVDF